MNVPFVDLKCQYANIKDKIDSAIKNVVEETAFIRGKYVENFEKSYASEYGVKNCVSVGNGTEGIYIALKMLGIGPGDEVITTACSWIATSETITQTGAKPVFVDISPDCYTINTSLIRGKITKKTKAIIPVHFYGQPADMDKIMAIAQEYGLYVIEDCAQAHFAMFRGKKVGTIGNVGVFSFYPSKNLGAYGDAGCIITDNDELAYKMRLYANHGSVNKVDHLFEGINSRMDGLQASVLLTKLPYIHEWNKRRYENAMIYNSLLKDFEKIKIPVVRDECQHVFHVYAIRAEQRDELKEFLSSNGIQTVLHYPRALPFLSAYKYLNHDKDDFPVAYKHQTAILSLPMYPELERAQIEYVVKKIKEFYKSK